jgi:putative addiction module component (TIGR02574 family)
MTASPTDMSIERLTLQERLDLIAVIWDSIAENPEAIPMPAWHREELDRRLAAAGTEPAAGTPWEEVKDRLRDSPCPTRS